MISSDTFPTDFPPCQTFALQDGTFQTALATYRAKIPSSEYSASSIRNPLRTIMGSRSHVNVECSSRMCSSISARVQPPSRFSYVNVAHQASKFFAASSAEKL